jgi:flavin-dependent dehydrogenase
VREGIGLDGAAQSAERVTLSLTDGSSIDATFVIGADGMWSPLRKALGVETPGYLGEWHAFRQYWRGVTGPARGRLWVLFEPDVIPGYVWSFPLGGDRANVGFGILRGSRVTTHDMKELWPEVLARPHVRALLGPDAAPDAPHKAWPIPARIGGVALTDGRVLFVGDAAAACDPLTGEGIGQALATGRWAAEAIAFAAQPAAVTVHYEARVARELAVDHRLAGALGRVLAHRWVARLSLAATDVNDWTRRNFGRWLFEDYPRAVLATPARWHRGMLSEPGAYR